jgi:hypothetical protein
MQREPNERPLPKKKKHTQRKEFLREKRKNASPTDKILEASSEISREGSPDVITIRDRTGGRARNVRRG